MIIPLAALEEITGTSGVAPRIEALLPIGVRRRQLRVRTLLAGMLLSQADQRPAHLTRVRDALTALPEPDQVRLGVPEDWKTGPHQLTYRQTERTFGLVTGALAKDAPDGLPSQALAADLRRPAGGIHPRSVQGRQHGAGRRLDRRGNLLPAAVSRQQRLRRPRSLLGAPLRRRPRPGQRAVLRLLRLGRHHDARGTRPAGARAGPPDDRLFLPSRPGPRPGPGADRDAPGGHPARRHPGRLRLRPPRRRRLGGAAAPGRGAAGPGPAPARPRPPRHPPRRHHRQRQPLLPGNTPHTARARAAGPRRHPRPGQRA